MFKNTFHIILFTCFALGLPLWAMQNNGFDAGSVHSCTGDCYQQWRQETGGVVAVVAAQAALKSAATPAELGEKAYAGCIACHGAKGEGGIGPALAGQSGSDISAKLLQYRNGEVRGSQSALMWSQSAQLGDNDIDNLAAYIESL